jgi:hypothetical protein
MLAQLAESESCNTTMKVSSLLLLGASFGLLAAIGALRRI